MGKLELTLSDIYVIVETLERSLHFMNWAGIDKDSRERVWSKIVNSQIVISVLGENDADKV